MAANVSQSAIPAKVNDPMVTGCKATLPPAPTVHVKTANLKTADIADGGHKHWPSR